MRRLALALAVLTALPAAAHAQSGPGSAPRLFEYTFNSGIFGLDGRLIFNVSPGQGGQDLVLITMVEAGGPIHQAYLVFLTEDDEGSLTGISADGEEVTIYFFGDNYASPGFIEIGGSGYFIYPIP